MDVSKQPEVQPKRSTFETEPILNKTIEQMSSVENLGWLFDIGDYTTQQYFPYNKPI